MGKLKIWALEEDKILIAVSNAIKSKKWKKASQELRKHGFERSDVECRERFINHLDPTVNKELWTQQELDTLYQKYGQYGNKWFLLQKHLPGRTQTKIKNYFYGNIRYLLKIVVKFYSKKSTGFINDIKTQTLLDVYQGKGQFQDNLLVEKTIKKLGFKVDKKDCEELIRENSQLFSDFITHFLEVTEKDLQESSQEYNNRDSYEPQPKAFIVECLPQVMTKVEVVCSTSGDVIQKESELEYLNTMMTLHLKWHRYFESRYQAVLGLIEQKSTQ